jgi:hypothetical protein
MAVNIAEMRERGSLQNSSNPAYGYGQKDSYSEVSGLGDVRGRLRKLGGNRTNDFGEVSFSNRWEWIVRFETAIETNLFKSSRWVIENRFFTIDSYELMGNRKRFYRFVLTEKE